MFSITAQQTKLDLELVPKENRLDIGKCNGRIPQGLTPREPTFQVILDAIALTPCSTAFLIAADVPERTFAALINRGLTGKTSGLDKLRLSRAQILWGMYYQKNVDYVELLWEDFVNQINNKVYKKQENMYYPQFTKSIIHHFLIQEKTLCWRNKIGMHTSKDDYLINTLRFVSAKEATQIYEAVLPECAVPPKMAQKSKKASPSKKDSDLVPIDEEPVQKGKRSKSKEKEKVYVTRGKGIELLSEVALTEEAQMKEVRNKSLRDFHKTRPSSSGTVAKKPQSVDKSQPTCFFPTKVMNDDSNNKQESSNEGSEQENKSDEQESDSEQEEEYEDDDQEEEEFVHTPPL
ncbi:hypothetical protein Tco_0038266 [Tanacetum coccineum]